MSQQASTLPEESTEFPFDRSKLAMRYDFAKLQQDVINIVRSYHPFYIHYNIVPLTMPGGKRADDKNGPKDNNDYSDPEWTVWQESAFLRDSPYIKEVLNSLECEKTNIRLMRLAPGSHLDEHCDPQLDLKFRKQIRLHVPIFTNESVEFLLNKKPVPLLPGELWYLKLSDPHSVVNAGQTERIQLSIDVVVNDWIENKIRDGEITQALN